VNTRIALATTKKNQLSVSDYYIKMSAYADELATSGTPLCDDEFVAYLLAGLDEDYNPVFTAVVARVDPIMPSELYSQLLSFEQHTNLQVHASTGGAPSAMATSRDQGFSGGRGPSSSNRGHSCTCHSYLTSGHGQRCTTLPDSLHQQPIIGTDLVGHFAPASSGCSTSVPALVPSVPYPAPVSVPRVEGTSGSLPALHTDGTDRPAHVPASVSDSAGPADTSSLTLTPEYSMPPASTMPLAAAPHTHI
jgi:hypothetical protein